MFAIRSFLTLSVGLAAIHSARSGDDPRSVDFFEAKIRPVLVEQCLKCHSEAAERDKKLRGGLKLDTKANWTAGGDNGPAIAPGKLDEGTLIASLKYEGDTQMPPKGKLPDAVIADFEKWVKDGAVDPRTATAAKKTAGSIDLDKGRTFWSLQPLKLPSVPETRDSGVAIRTPVDAFVQAKWEALGLRPAPAADKRTLIRRAYFDLVGLPPAPKEIEAFERDDSAGAFAKVVDRLLASPRYGERWARHWLDVARYAEDQAHTFGVKPKSNAYVYRDWVIQAFNSDMPYDRFVKLQIAGDLMPATTEDDIFTRLAGLGYLGLGANYYKNSAKEQAIAEELDDRVDTLTRGFLGLTVSCARCHDHKFDPIPTRDYYSIAGIYYGTNLSDASLARPEVQKVYNDSQKGIKEGQDAIDQLLSKAGLTAVKAAMPRTAKYLLAVRKVRETKVSAAEVARSEGLDPYFLERWVKFLNPANADKRPPDFKEWLALKADAKPEDLMAMAQSLSGKVEKIELPETLAPPANGKKNGKAKGTADALAKAVLLDPAAPLFVALADAEKTFLAAEDRPRLAEMRLDLESRKKAAPPAPLQAPVVSGSGQGMKIYIRGNPMTKGDDAPKGFLQVLCAAGQGENKKDYTRLDLANSIADPANPLTARVFVNRIWQQHFGRGIVATPSNFGLLGERPSHPELLDYLAVEFVKQGWSTKWLHRQIMLSAAYQLASDDDEANDKIDGADVYLWRAPRRRLDVETWRDSLLQVSGNLDETLGGPSFDLKDPTARRRTIYAKISRHELDGLLRLFDFPDANVTADKRSVTTVPQQQLFALNSEFMVNQAKAFAERISKLGKTDEERIAAAYRLALGRAPDSREIEIATGFLKLPAKPEDKLTRLQQYAQALLAGNEFMYVD